MQYAFADCTLDTQIHVLWRSGTLHYLRPKVFQVLQYLLQHCDRVVSKREMAEQLWPEQSISDAVVENAMMAVRRAVGDSGRVQRVIQTLPGYGYRFIAPVAESLDASAGGETFAGSTSPDVLTALMDLSCERSAYVEASHHLTRSLDFLKTLPHTPGRIRYELSLRMLLGPALMALHGYGAPEVQDVYARARELCHQVGDNPQLFPAVWGLYAFYLVRADCHTAHELALQCLRMSQQAQDPVLLLRAQLALGETLFWLGEVSAARPHLGHSLALYDAQQQRSSTFLYGQNPAVVGYTYAALALWWLGYPDQAVQECYRALTLAQELAHPHSLVWAVFFTAILHSLRREVQAVQERAEAVLALSTKHGFPFWGAVGMILRGWALTAQGAAAEGLPLMHQGLDAYDATGAALGRPYFLALLAEAYGTTAQAEAGLQVLAKALAIVDKSGEHGFTAELYRLQGELLLQQAGGAPAEEAEACFRQAFKTASHQGATLWKLRAAVSLCRLWQHRSTQEANRQMLAEVCLSFTEGFATADLQEAQALLAAITPHLDSQEC